MAASFRRSVFEITDEESLEPYPLDEAASTGDEPESRDADTEDPAASGDLSHPGVSARRRLPHFSPSANPTATGAAVIAALGVVVWAALHLVGGSREPSLPAVDRAPAPSVRDRRRQAVEPTPPTDYLPPRRPANAGGPRAASDGGAKEKASRPVEIGLPAKELHDAPITPTPARVPPVAPLPPVVPLGRALGEEFGIER